MYKLTLEKFQEVLLGIGLNYYLDDFRIESDAMLMTFTLNTKINDKELNQLFRVSIDEFLLVKSVCPNYNNGTFKVRIFKCTGMSECQIIHHILSNESVMSVFADRLGDESVKINDIYQSLGINYSNCEYYKFIGYAYNTGQTISREISTGNLFID
jgi:hypothetical protein